MSVLSMLSDRVNMKLSGYYTTALHSREAIACNILTEGLRFFVVICVFSVSSFLDPDLTFCPSLMQLLY